MPDRPPSRGEVWKVRLRPIEGHEQGGERPCLIYSDDRWNQGRSGLVIIIPMTSTIKEHPFHVEVVPPEGGLQVRSNILCEHIRSVSTERLIHSYGTVSPQTLSEVGQRVRVLLNL